MHRADAAWHGLYVRTFGDSKTLPVAAAPSPPHHSWRQRFQQQFAQRAREKRLRRRVKLIKLQSSCAALARDLQHLNSDRRNELRILANVRRELDQLRRMR
jgi:hypothetical protein